LWVHKDDLAKHNVLPTPLIQWLQDDNHELWGSTMNG
jgi:hypothetical protein